jgi:hypothetical protein
MGKISTYLYHVTPYESAKKIIDCGYIDPHFSQGARRVCWFVVRTKVTWAIAHVAQKHAVGIEQLAILTVKTTRLRFGETNHQGIWCYKNKIPIVEMVSAAVWLSREESYVHIKHRRRPRTFVDGEYNEY